MIRILIAGLVLLSANVFGQLNPEMATDIVDTLDLTTLKPTERATIARRLEGLRPKSKGKRLQKVSFLLAALGSHYVANRDYLVATLRTCSSRPSDCDEDAAEFLSELYRRGHREVLLPLMIAGLKSDGALAESLGSFYAEALTKSPVGFVPTLRRLDAAHQKAVCELAGSLDGSGMDPDTLERVRQILKRIGDSIAMRCLTQIETVSRELAKQNQGQ